MQELAVEKIGSGSPLVLLHGTNSTVHETWGPCLAELDTEMMLVSTSRRGLTRLGTDLGSSKGSVGSGREVLVALIGRGVVTS